MMSNVLETSSQLQNPWKEESFNLGTRYQVHEFLGAGAYGVVCAAQDVKKNESVAVKKCKNIFQCDILAKRTLREIRILRLLDNKHIVRLLDILEPEDSANFDCLYVVFEIMDTDLAQVIKSPQRLRDQHIQYFTYQILRGLNYLHSSRIVHRDLKPRNILVNADCQLKIADFGLARYYDNYTESTIVPMTEYVTTRWYRAPEVLIGWPRYGAGVDIWALGCIIAELILRHPLFPGLNSLDQLESILKLLGKPGETFISHCKKPSHINLMTNFNQNDVKDLYKSLRPEKFPLAVNLIKRLLVIDPNERWSAKEALDHPYIEQLHRSTNEVDCPVRFKKEEFRFDKVAFSSEDYKQEFLNEIRIHRNKASEKQSRLWASVVDSISKTFYFGEKQAQIYETYQENNEEQKWEEEKYDEEKRDKCRIHHNNYGCLIN